MELEIRKSNGLRGELTVPGDKSISHRAVMFGALAEGETCITHFLQGADCLSTIDCFARMGIRVDRDGDQVLVHGKGLHGLTRPSEILNVGNSGTTTRLMSGILAGQSFESRIDGDASTRKRPMQRIITPLTLMGAGIRSEAGTGCLPLTITGGNLHGIDYRSSVASAQVKSCILLAGLYGDSPTSVTEPALSRDHTERMLRAFGAEVKSEGTRATILPDPVLHGQKIEVPGDISSAAYFIAAAAITPGSEILLKNVGINPTRDGMLQVCRSMGVDLTCLNVRQGAEPSADLLIRYSELKGTEIGGDLIPSLIDELPVIAVMAAFAEGTTVIRDAGELRVKESDRIETVSRGLRAMGCDVLTREDGMEIHGTKDLKGAEIDPALDHRVAMSFAVAGCACGNMVIRDAECVRISYPSFYEDLQRISS